jgi:hypothetical protein
MRRDISVTTKNMLQVRQATSDFSLRHSTKQAPRHTQQPPMERTPKVLSEEKQPRREGEHSPRRGT